MDTVIDREVLLKNVYFTKMKSSPSIYFKFKWETTYHTTKFTKMEEAEDYVISLLIGEEKKREIPTLQSFAQDFFDYEKSEWIKRQVSKGRPFSESHAKDRKWALDKIILPQFGKRLITSITATEIDDWLLNLDFSAQTKNHILFAFRTVLREAQRQNIISKNPAESIDRYVVNHNRRDIYTTDEINMLFPRTLSHFLEIWEKPSVGLLCYLNLMTGMRHGEARALQWKDIIYEKDMILITKAMKRNNTIGPTKNGKPRIVFLLERVKPILDYYKKQSSFAAPTDFIFTSNGKKPFWTNFTYKYYHKALEKIKIEKGTRNLDIHSFRHTNITISRKHGLDEDTLQRLIGHEAKTITDVYDHRELHDILNFLSPYKDKLENIWEEELSHNSNNFQAAI